MSESTAFHALAGKHHRLEARVDRLEGSLRLLLTYMQRHGDGAPNVAEYKHIIETLSGESDA